MADLTELKNMVMSFRVSELQVLLGFAGRNKSGRKQELLQRALTLIHRGCNHPIQIKIKELYRRRYPGKPSTSPPHPVQPPSRVGSSSSSSVQGKRERDRATWMKYPSSNMSSYGAYPNHSALGFTKPSVASNNQSSTIPIHPDVRLKWLPFYDVLGELLKTSSLVPRNQNRFQENVFVFHLTPQQAQEIALSRDLRPGARCEFTVQVQLRFSLLETTCPQEDNFPPSVCVRVNEKLATLPNPIPTNKPGVEPKRPSRPVNITSICRLSPTIANQVNITWASEYGRSYCVSVSLVRRLTASLLLQRLKSSGLRHPDHTRALIKEKLSHDPDSEIATTSLRVSLLCPLGKMRMQIPCRASTCAHLQCFDATTYLQMNEKKPSWTCPVCDRPAEFDKLAIDGLFTEILTQVTETSEIELLDNGSWQPMKPKENKEKATNHVIQTIGDSPKKAEPDVIDLTETDDEDDMAVINTSTCSSDSSSSASDSSIVTATPTSSIHESEDVKIIGRLPGGASGPASSSSSSSISLAPGPSTSNHNSTGCVSPPLISLDTPPHAHHAPTPPSLPRTPQPRTARSPYASPYASPHHGHFSPHSRISPHTPHHTRGTPPHLPQPPPAHSNSTQLQLNPTPPPSYLSHLGAGPNFDPISDTEFEEFLSLMTGVGRSGYNHPSSHIYSPFYAGLSHPSASSSASSSCSLAPENLSLRDSRNRSAFSTAPSSSPS